MQVTTEQVADFYKLMPLKATIDESKIVAAPMPGLVKSVNCSVGDEVAAGQEVCVIEAMKMQNSLSMAASGKVLKVNCVPGDKVEESQVLIELA